MLSYLIFYIFEISLYILGKFLKLDKTALALSFILSVLFSGFRFQTGNDYPAYYSYFIDFNNINVSIEPGFYTLCLVANYLSIHPFFIFFIFSFATYFLIYKSCKNLINSGLCYLIFLLTPGLFLNTFHMPRQYFALAIFLFASIILVERKSLRQYFLLAILAGSFHYTSIIAFFIGYLFYYFDIKIPKPYQLVLILISGLGISYSGIIEYLLPKILTSGSRYEIYATWNDAESIQKLITVFAISLVPILKSRKFNTSPYNYFFKLWFFGVFFLFVFSHFSSITRISYYFTFFLIPVYIYSATFYKNYLKNIFILFLIIIYSGATFLAIYGDYNVNGYDNEATLWNYRTIIELF